MGTVVHTCGGAVEGFDDDGTVAFLGIPYAAPPVGELRMRPPRPPRQWSGVHPADTFGPTAVQTAQHPPYDTLFPSPDVPGDACLNLNVWTPAADDGARPVMVWIHGGAWNEGSSAVPQYRGQPFARDGIVFVSVNYRLGAEGLLYTGDDDANCALLDMVLALNWVQNNIEAFGGDPERVTVAGQASGAMSVATLMAMPRAKGLFARAIMQSGSAEFTMTTRQARRITRLFADDLGIPATREAFVTVAPQRLADAHDRLAAEVASSIDVARWGGVLASRMMFQPVTGTPTLPDPPADVIARGDAAHIGLLIGTTTDEQRAFLVPDGGIDRVTWPVLIGAAAEYGLGPLGIRYYVGTEHDRAPGDVFAAISTDWFFRVPSVRVADAQAKAGGGPGVYMYEFAWRPPTFDGRLGACHALDLGFTFDGLGAPGVAELAGDRPPQSLADLMHRDWVSFVRDGRPADDAWPRYDAVDRPVRVFDAEPGVAYDPYADRVRHWHHR
ncbi:carboxylesterase/lipase family protein [Nocardiopsis sediminis]|uniref:Carboxylesterase/lipase family protein n=1 Tax=Nocardiopsis sediminis TaxID=1778267 RepID=A0ABV8FHG0_9ACTN